MRIRQPGVYGPHRYLDRERGEEREKNEHLFVQAQRQALKHEQIVAAGLQIQIDQRNEHQQGAEKCIEEKLDAGVNAARTAPYADDDEHRNQHHFPKDVEQNGIECSEHADHGAFQDQEGREILRDPLLYAFPAGDHDQDRRERRQQDQRHRDTVDADEELRVERRNPRYALDELHVEQAGIETGIERQTEDETRHSGCQGQPARRLRACLAKTKHDDAAQDGQADQQRKQVLVNRQVRHNTHNNREASPRIIANA